MLNKSDAWDLEEVPFENNDPAGGWYLHFDTEADHEVLYMSKSNVSEKEAKLMAAAPELLEALKGFVVLYKQGQLVLEGDDDGNDPLVAEALKAIAKATGGQLVLERDDDGNELWVIAIAKATGEQK